MSKNNPDIEALFAGVEEIFQCLGLYTVIVEKEGMFFLHTATMSIPAAEHAMEAAGKAFPYSNVYVFTRHDDDLIQMDEILIVQS